MLRARSGYKLIMQRAISDGCFAAWRQAEAPRGGLEKKFFESLGQMTELCPLSSLICASRRHGAWLSII